MMTMAVRCAFRAWGGVVGAAMLPPMAFAVQSAIRE